MGHVQESVEILSCRMCPAGKYTYSIEQNRKGVQNKFTWEMKKNCVDQMVGLPAEAEAGCLSGPSGLGGKIYGITSLVIIPAYNL